MMRVNISSLCEIYNNDSLVWNGLVFDCLFIRTLFLQLHITCNNTIRRVTEKWKSTWLEHATKIEHHRPRLPGGVMWAIDSMATKVWGRSPASYLHSNFHRLCQLLPGDAMQSALMKLHIVSLFVCPYVCNVQVPWSHRLEYFENNFTAK